MLKNEADFKDLLFFDSRDRIVGLDPTTMTVKAAIKFNKAPTWGAKHPDGRIVFGLDSYDKVYVIDHNANILSSFSAQYSPDEVFIFGNRLCVTTSIYNDPESFQVFDMNNNYNKIFDKDIMDGAPKGYRGFMENGRVYFHLTPFEDLYVTNSRPSRLNSMDTNDFSITERTDCFTYPTISSDVFLENGIVYIVYLEFHKLSVYNLNTSNYITNIDLRAVVHFPQSIETNLKYYPKKEGFSELTAYQPIIIGNDLLVFFHSDIYQSIAVFDKKDFHLKTNMNVSFLTNADKIGLHYQNCYKYIVGTKIYFAFFGGSAVTEYDHATGKFRTALIYEE